MRHNQLDKTLFGISVLTLAFFAAQVGFSANNNAAVVSSELAPLVKKICVQTLSGHEICPQAPSQSGKVLLVSKKDLGNGNFAVTIREAIFQGVIGNEGPQGGLVLVTVNGAPQTARANDIAVDVKCMNIGSLCVDQSVHELMTIQAELQTAKIKRVLSNGLIEIDKTPHNRLMKKLAFVDWSKLKKVIPGEASSHY